MQIHDASLTNNAAEAKNDSHEGCSIENGGDRGHSTHCQYAVHCDTPGAQHCACRAGRGCAAHGKRHGDDAADEHDGAHRKGLKTPVLVLR